MTVSSLGGGYRCARSAIRIASERKSFAVEVSLAVAVRPPLQARLTEVPREEAHVRAIGVLGRAHHELCADARRALSVSRIGTTKALLADLSSELLGLHQPALNLVGFESGRGDSQLRCADTQIVVTGRRTPPCGVVPSIRFERSIGHSSRPCAPSNIESDVSNYGNRQNPNRHGPRVWFHPSTVPVSPSRFVAAGATKRCASGGST